MTSRNQGLSSNDQGRQRRETLGTRLPAPGFHVGKIPGDQECYFLPTIPDFVDIQRIFSRGLSRVFPIMNLAGNHPWREAISICDRWTWAEQFSGVVMSKILDGTNLSFQLSGMIGDHRRNLGRVGKIETLLIL